MWDLIIIVPNHCLLFYTESKGAPENMFSTSESCVKSNLTSAKSVLCLLEFEKALAMYGIRLLLVFLRKNNIAVRVGRKTFRN